MGEAYARCGHRDGVVPPGTPCPPTFMNVHISLTQLLEKMEFAEVKIKVIPEIAE